MEHFIKHIRVEVTPNIVFQTGIQFNILQFFPPCASQDKFLYILFGVEISLFCLSEKTNKLINLPVSEILVWSYSIYCKVTLCTNLLPKKGRHSCKHYSVDQYLSWAVTWKQEEKLSCPKLSFLPKTTFFMFSLSILKLSIVTLYFERIQRVAVSHFQITAVFHWIYSLWIPTMLALFSGERLIPQK